MKIVSWQSVLTDHQSHTIRELQKVVQEPVLIVSGVKELAARQRQGWSAPDVSDLQVRYLPSNGWWEMGISIFTEHKNATHMFNTMWGDRRFYPLLIAAKWYGVKTVLMTEPYSEVGVGYLDEDSTWGVKLKAFLRPWLYRYVGGHVAKNFSAIFAISNKAAEQFERIGVDKEKIFPFGYFVPPLPRPKLPIRNRDDALNLIFVGSLIKRKGIDSLIEAIKICEIKGFNVVLDVYGPGKFDKLKCINNVQHRGVIPFGHAQEVISNYDVLVLPSLYDGWGVVVNEALLQGVPVIVSDQVGAKCLIEKSGAGEVIKVNDVGALSNCFQELIINPDRLETWKYAALKFSPCLMPKNGAQYLYDCLYPSSPLINESSNISSFMDSSDS